MEPTETPPGNNIDTEESIRVLIADDSFCIRRYLVELLASEPDIEIVGTASNGDEVVLLAAKLLPDVITMDYNMPGKNGIEAAAAIMLGERPLPSIIMLSAFEGKEGQEMRRTLEASGAQVIMKPSGEVSLDIERVAANIVTKIREVGLIEKKIRKSYNRIHHSRTRFPRADKSGAPKRVVVIGASTGGPPLIEHLLTSIEPNLGVACVIAQHMSKYFTELFAERLNRVTGFIVREAKSGDVLMPGVALVVPGGFALDFVKEKDTHGRFVTKLMLAPTALAQHEDEIDKTMKAIAECFGPLACAVLLSGMGSDGAMGIKAIKRHGGHTIIQDPHTATVSSMPEHAMHEGDVDAVLSIEDMPAYITDLFTKKSEEAS